MSERALHLALFDLDGTLIPGDTELEWAYLLGEHGLIDPTPFDRFHQQYLDGTLVLQEYYDWYLPAFCDNDRATLERIRDQLVHERLLPTVPDRARRWLDEARGRGATLLLVTASNHFLTEPLGRELGFEDTLATRLREIDGRLTSAIDGEACYREHKITAVERWLAGRGKNWSDVGKSSFHSDSHNDLPLLRHVDHAFAVEPDATLRSAAEESGWPILSFE